VDARLTPSSAKWSTSGPSIGTSVASSSISVRCSGVIVVRARRTRLVGGSGGRAAAVGGGAATARRRRGRRLALEPLRRWIDRPATGRLAAAAATAAPVTTSA
jgi:hypothetical protein